MVNDDCRLAGSVVDLLVEEGYEAIAAADGDEAVTVLKHWPAELVILDLIMPRLDGWDFLTMRLGDDDMLRSRVLVWSAASRDGLDRARLLGAADCLPRDGTTPDSLLEAVGRLLKH